MLNQGPAVTVSRHVIAWSAGVLMAATLTAVALIGSSATPAHADAKCAAACNANHDQCMKSSNDRYSCDSQRNQCLKQCYGG